MPRRPRIIVPNIPLHIIQRGNNRQSCFFEEEDYLFYLDSLKNCAKSSSCSVHAYVLMTNHIHILLTPGNSESAGTLMKHLGQRYTQYINRTYKRSGTLWEGRFRSSIVQQEKYLFSCQRYIELNPLRAGMAKHPGDYPWSSYHSNALGSSSALLSQHFLYQNLGQTDVERQEVYRKLLCHNLKQKELDAIRKAVNGNFALGNRQFEIETGEMLGRRVKPGKPGRPRKKKS